MELITFSQVRVDRRHDASLAIISMARFAIEHSQNIYASPKANPDAAAKVGGTSKRHTARKHGNKFPIRNRRIGVQPFYSPQLFEDPCQLAWQVNRITTRQRRLPIRLQFPSLRPLSASQAGKLRGLGDERRFLVMIIGSSQTSWVVAENAFEVMGYKKAGS